MYLSKIKSGLKQSKYINSLNNMIKSKMHEQQAKKSSKYYKEKIKNLYQPLKKNDIAVVLNNRIRSRGNLVKPKKMGDMHIFLTFALNNWEDVLAKALRPFGKVTVFEWRSFGFDDNSRNWLKYRDSMNEEMLKIFQGAHSQKPVDAVIGYLSGYNVSPQILIEMRKSGSILFNFCWDDKLNFPGKIIADRYTSPAAIASSVDLNLTNSPESVIKYSVHGGIAMFWPEAAHPEMHKPYGIPFEYDVSFVGTKYGWRPQFIGKLNKMGIKVTCFGNGWGNGVLTNEEMIKTYSCSRINLGFAGVGHSRKIMSLKGRDFEIPMSGGFYLTQDNPELSLVYRVGEEIVTYIDEKDCFKKIKYYLAHPVEANKIRDAGRRRALRDHSWEKRFEQIFKITGLMKNNDIERTY